jgi:hypothetical protein
VGAGLGYGTGFVLVGLLTFWRGLVLLPDRER